MSSRLAVAAAVLLVAALGATVALADGDPASDVLVSSDVFFPSPAPTSAAQARLTESVKAVVAHGDRVKVAVIASKEDLGAIPSLFGKPQAYAKFLGLELRFVYSGALLIAMRQGFGFYDGGRDTVKATEALQGVAVAGRGADALSRSAASAVEKLEAAGALRFKDTVPPQLYVVQTTGRRGRSALLHYWGLDNSGKASVAASITRGTAVLASFKSKLRPLTPALVYSFRWTIPATIRRGPAAFCARATDATGNRSPRTCTDVKVT